MLNRIKKDKDIRKKIKAPNICGVNVLYCSGVFSGQYRDEAMEEEVVCPF